MADIKLVVVGAGGRMGQALVKAICEIDGVCVSGALDREGSDCLGKDAGELAGIGTINVAISDNIEVAFANAEGILDFTSPQASLQFSKIAAERGLTHIIGTTGCSVEQDAQISEAGKSARIVKSGNMSLGVNLLSVLVQKAAAALDEDWDLEVLEMHHKHKVDAPSGTALLLGEAAANGRSIDLEQSAVKSREGHTGARERGSIGFATLRGGSVVGDHTVMLAGEGEIIELSHKALDRSIFARGAVKAAIWANKQNPGFYTMLDVLGLSN